MPTPIFLLLSGSLLFITTVLLMVLMQERKNGQLLRDLRDREARFDLISFQMRELLTIVRWNSEMLIGHEFGKLEVSQLEIAEKIDTAVRDAVTLLQNYTGSGRK